MTGKRLSAEQVKAVAIFTGNPEGCFYTNGIERRTRVPGNTVRHFMFTLFRLRLLERVELHGGYRYRLSPEADKQPYYQRLQEAAAAMRP